MLLGKADKYTPSLYEHFTRKAENEFVHLLDGIVKYANGKKINVGINYIPCVTEVFDIGSLY